MCNFFSAIVLKNGEIVYDLNSSSHEDLIEKAGVKDETADPAELSFARIEILPDNNDVFQKKWCLKIDQSITPDWFSDEYKKKCMDIFFKEVYPACVFIEKKDLRFKNRKNLFLKDSSADLHDSSSAVLTGKSSADLFGSSSADLFGSSFADLYGSSYAILSDSSYAILSGSSSAKLFGSSSAKLFDSSSAVLHDSSSADLYGSSSADLHGSSSADLHGSSSAKLFDSSYAVLSDSSSAVNFSEKAKFITNNSSIVIDRSRKDSIIQTSNKSIKLKFKEV